MIMYSFFFFLQKRFHYFQNWLYVFSPLTERTSCECPSALWCHDRIHVFTIIHDADHLAESNGSGVKCLIKETCPGFVFIKDSVRDEFRHFLSVCCGFRRDRQTWTEAVSCYISVGVHTQLPYIPAAAVVLQKSSPETFFFFFFLSLSIISHHQWKWLKISAFFFSLTPVEKLTYEVTFFFGLFPRLPIKTLSIQLRKETFLFSSYHWVTLITLISLGNYRLRRRGVTAVFSTVFCDYTLICWVSFCYCNFL